MKAVDLMELAKGFDDIVESIKSGEVTTEQFKEEFDNMQEQIDITFDIALRVFAGEETPEIGDAQKLVIIQQAREEEKSFNYKEHKKLVLNLLIMVDNMDKQIGSELFLPFMRGILSKSKDVMLAANPSGEAEKAIRKAIKKFNKMKIEEDTVVSEVQ